MFLLIFIVIPVLTPSQRRVSASGGQCGDPAVVGLTQCSQDDCPRHVLLPHPTPRFPVTLSLFSRVQGLLFGLFPPFIPFFVS